MTGNRGYPARLYGRQDECDLIAELVDGVRRGHGAVLVVRGEPGTGKTALLDHAAGLAAGLRVVRAAGAESEADLAYAGLCQLCGPLSGLFCKLPGPQRAALETVFGLRADAAPDRFLVGLGVHGLLTEAAAEGPLVCVIDNAHWLDRASQQALAFAARRLAAGSVLAIFAARQRVTDLDGLPDLALGALPDTDARNLLAAVAPGPLDERVRDQILAEAHGNPRALTDLFRGLPPVRLGGGFGLQEMPRSQIPAAVRRQIAALPAQARSLLLLAAADPTGDPVLVLRAAGKMGISPEAVYPAQEAGLLTFGARVVFRQPAVRGAAYLSAPQRDRQAAHGALARATVQPGDEDRRAWHRAKATLGPDEDAAAELERTAAQAQARGGLPALAAFLSSAVLLTADAQQRSRRALAAASAMLHAGEPDSATRLLDLAAGGLMDDRLRARAGLVRSSLARVRGRYGEIPLLLDMASVAREMPHDGLATPADLLVDGLAAYLTGEGAAGEPVLRQALNDFGRDMTAQEELCWLPLACAAALYLWDDSAWASLSGRHASLARGTGAHGDLPLALDSLACLHLLGGELGAAESLAAEARAVARATRSRPSPCGALGAAAARGHQDLAREMIDGAARRDEGLGIAAAKWAAAVLHNGLGQHETALSAAEDAVRYAGAAPLAGWAAAELVEAAARSGRPARAAEAMRGLSQSDGATGTDWALGIRTRSLALLSDGAAAEDRYQAAIGHLGRSRARVDLARARLLYGEWLRRENRRVDAREQLRLAHEMLDAIGADAFAERARRELLATGESVRKRTGSPVADRDLTAQETQIAVRARDGQTNTQIGAELFLSPRTVEWHLRKVFAKLGIASRTQLRHALHDAAAVPGGSPGAVTGSSRARARLP